MKNIPKKRKPKSQKEPKSQETSGLRLKLFFDACQIILVLAKLFVDALSFY